MKHFGRLALLAALAFVAASPAPAASPDELVVDARYPEGDQGTTHVAESLTLSIGSARPLRLAEAILPIPGPTFHLPDSRFLLLGWSSAGGGMQTIHAYLVGVRNGAVVRLDALASTTDRPHAGILVRKNADGSIALGVPEPPKDFLHDEDAWSLVAGSRSRILKISAIRRLAYDSVTVGTDDLFYSPPAKLAPRPARVAWVAITPRGFVVP